MQIEIAVFGKNKEIIDTLERIINNNEEWKAFPAIQQEDLKVILQNNPIKILLYSSGIGTSEVEETEKWVDDNYTNVIQIHHFGGGSGLLKCEINSALEGIKPINKPFHNAIS